MALKPDRSYVDNDSEIGYFMNTTGERGIIVVHDTSVTGSGAALDDAGSVVKIPGTASGSRPAGLLLTNVVDYDPTRQHRNYHQDEALVGGKVTIARRGWFVTNKVTGSPTAGQKAYYDDNGNFSAAVPGGVDVVGRFGSSKDADGYIKVFINIV